MIFVAILYSQYELKEVINLDDTRSISPLGWAPLREVGNGSWRTGGFKFVYIEKNVDRPSMENIGFKNTKIKTFLEFFSFITGDGWSIQEFEERQEGCKHFESETEVNDFLTEQAENETKEGSPVIESNFLIQYSFRTVIGEIVFSKAWELFLQKEDKFRDMVSIYCARLVGPRNGVFEVFNKDTVILFHLLALIEGLLPRRTFCKTKFDCPECKKKNIQHYPQNTYEYWKLELDKKLQFNDNSKYIDLVVAMHRDMRNSFAHVCSLLSDVDLTRDCEAQGAHTRFMFLSDVITLKDKDSLARSNICILMFELARLLLLSEFFPENICTPWPDLVLLKEYHSG